jgi:hypothetical protein
MHKTLRFLLLGVLAGGVATSAFTQDVPASA